MKFSSPLLLNDQVEMSVVKRQESDRWMRLNIVVYLVL